MGTSRSEKRLSIFSASQNGIQRKPLLSLALKGVQSEQKLFDEALAELKKNEATVSLAMRAVGRQLADYSAVLKKLGLPVEEVMKTCKDIHQRTNILFSKLPETFNVQALNGLYNAIQSEQFIELINAYRKYNQLYPMFALKISNFLNSEAGRRLTHKELEVFSNKLIIPVQHSMRYELQLKAIYVRYQKCPIFEDKDNKFETLQRTIQEITHLLNVSQDHYLSEALFKDFLRTKLSSPNNKRGSLLQPGRSQQEFLFLCERIKMLEPRNKSENDLLFIKERLKGLDLNTLNINKTFPTISEIQVMNERVNEIKHLRFIKVLKKVIAHNKENCFSIFWARQIAHDKDELIVLKHFINFAERNLKLSKEKMFEQWLDRFAKDYYADAKDRLSHKFSKAFTQYYGDAYKNAPAPTIPVRALHTTKHVRIQI